MGEILSAVWKENSQTSLPTTLNWEAVGKITFKIYVRNRMKEFIKGWYRDTHKTQLLPPVREIYFRKWNKNEWDMSKKIHSSEQIKYKMSVLYSLWVGATALGTVDISSTLKDHTL